MAKKILLSGYFGYDNLGDEAILYSIVEELKKIDDVELVALSGNPQKTTEKFGIYAVERMKLFPVLKELSRCDIFLSGGGSLLQDVTSKRSIQYYMGLLRLAKRFFRKRVMIYSQGIGPVDDAKNRAKIGKLLNQMDIVNVRDEQSKIELVDMGVRKNISVTADTVFLLERHDRTFGKEYLSKNLDLNKKTVGVSIRPWKDCDDRIVSEMVHLISVLQEREVNIVLLPFHHPGDLRLSQRVFEQLAFKNNVHLATELFNEREMLSITANLDVMLSMRLHGLIFGVVSGAYPVAISYDPKIDSLMKELEMPEAADVESLDYESLCARILDAVDHLYERKEQTERTAQKMRERALENIKLVKELVR